MIDITLSDKAYENDVYPLVKAFYPEKTIHLHSREEDEKAGAEAKVKAETKVEAKTETKAEDIETDKADLYLKMEFKADEIEIVLQRNAYSIDEIHFQAMDTYTTKSEYKNAMKRFLYHHLSDMSGKSLPWGILTGIRPTKLVYEMLEQGWQDTEIRQRMQEEYLCSEEKISVSIRIAKRELELLNKMDYRNGYSLYIGIPFCPTTCLYCSFTSYSITKFAHLVDRYLDALDKEIEYAASCIPEKKLTTVYFGGGTPTTLSAEQLDRLLRKVSEHFDLSQVQEFCVEAGRPDSITPEKLQVLKKWKVDRISINPQSMQQRTLDLIGRRHSTEEIVQAFHMARDIGFDNINMDIIIGLPEEGPEDVLDTLRQIGELKPDGLTVHTLALKRAARLNLEKESYADRKAFDVPKMLEHTTDFAEENSYLPYYLYRQKNMADNLENVGYARYGKEGLYNILIMEEKQTILALGAGGMSKFVFHDENRLERVDNVKSVNEYIERVDEMIARKQNFLNANKV